MTTVFNRPETFRDDMLEGLVAAYSGYVKRVDGAAVIMRRGGVPVGKVALVIGGGSGHYPTFAGFVGEGLADGAVVGDIFTSPSAEQVHRAVRAADAGAGVLLSYGRYSGDVMNFGMAQERARAEGVDVRTVLVTDDIASAPPERAEQRRGIAGDFFVFKVAGAAAEKGYSLDEVERLASKANACTRTLGVAFGGCTLPGREEPLFSVAADMMEVGLGIHGEPGVRTEQRMPARELAALLVEALLQSEERPEGAGRRATVLLDGLGRTKYEELFVLYAAVDRLLRAEGLEVVEPEVGELVTSLDMAGCSLTVAWLDEELEQLWRAPADCPGYRKRGDGAGSQKRALEAPARTGVGRGRARPGGDGLAGARVERVDEAATGAADPRMAEVARTALAGMLGAIEAAENELGDMDAVAGDGDHGRGMVRGLRAAVGAARVAGEVPGEVVRAAGTAWAAAAGGASGALWGAALEAFGRVLAREGLGPSGVGAGLDAAMGALAELGGARLGDKTMLDTLAPFVDAYRSRVAGGDDVATAWGVAAAVAEEAAGRTAGMVSKRGRSAVLGQRSVGTPDPGAVSMAYCLRAVGAVLSERSGESGGVGDGTRPGRGE